MVCAIRLILQVLGLLSVLINGPEINVGVPAIDLIMKLQFIGFHINGIIHFYTLLSSKCQSGFLQFINGMKKHSSTVKMEKTLKLADECPSLARRKMRLYAFMHFLVGTSWVPFWNAVFVHFARGIIPALRLNWYQSILGVAISPTEELSSWKLGIALLLVLAKIDCLTVAMCSIVLVHLVIEMLYSNMKSFVVGLERVMHFYAASSRRVVRR